MGNVIGEPTPSYVINQVNKRQEIHGKLTRTNEELNYLNSKTAWVKLISSVNITKDLPNPVIKNIGLTENKLAEQFVLFNGITDESPTSGVEETYQRAGIARDKSIDNTSAYGVGGLEFGLSPMMGLQSMNVSSKNRGSLRTAKVEIIANNRIQFEIIETLYIKLGYFMLLEWGWTNYYTSSGYVTDNPYSLADDFLLRNSGYDGFLKKIEDNRKASEGNYDALLGKVTNFSWTFTPEGQYKISLDMISQGDVIDSLKVNTLFPKDSKPSPKKEEDPKNDKGKQPSSETEEDPPKTPEDIIKSYMDKSSLGNYLGSMVNKLQGYGSLSHKFPGDDKSTKSFIKQKYSGTSSDDEGTTIYYISLRRLLLWIEENLIPNIKKGNSKFINFDLDVEDNLILLPPINISTDPRICNFNSQWTVNNDGGWTTLFEAEDFTKTIGNNTYGRVMNIYFNIQWILESFDQLEDDKGNVMLIDFLNTLLKGYEQTTGNYNTLSADIDPDTNVIIIRDETPQPDRKKDTPTAFFNTFGYQPSGGSNFVRNLNFNTTVSPKLATMITVGATRDGYSPGYDATGLQSINYGTFDAIKPELVNNSGKAADSTSSKEELKKAEAKYKEAYTNFQKYVRSLITKEGQPIPTLDPEAANAYSSTLKNLIEYKQLKQTKDNNKPYSGSPTVGFIPFDLGLDIDGLSGIKIYNKIAIETAFLPYNYPEALEFVIKGVDHTINGNDWVTNLTTLAIPKNPSGGGKPDNKTTGKTSGKRNSGEGSDPSSWTDKTITSGFPLNPKGHSKKETDKTQIILHYSAGWQKTDKGQSTINTLNKRGLSYHYIIDAAGHVEQVVPDRVRAYNAGVANTPSIGISLQNVGYGKNAEESSYGPMRKDQLTGNAHLVDHNGKNTTYRNISYAQEITDAQLNALKTLFKTLKTNNPTLPPYKWEGKKTYDLLFPPSVNGTKQTSWSKSKPGYYTHCGVTTQKLDCMPTPKIVQFFKDLVL